MEEKNLSKNAAENTAQNTDETLERLKKLGFEPVESTFSKRPESPPIPPGEEADRFEIAEVNLSEYISMLNNMEEILGVFCIDGIYTDNLEKVYRKLRAIIRSTRNMINKLPDMDEILKIPPDSNINERLEVITYDCFKDEFGIEFFDYYTKIITPKILSWGHGKKPSNKKLALNNKLTACLHGLFIQNKEQVPIIDRATLVVDTQGDIDHDNLDFKIVIDAFKSHFIFSDEGSMLDLHIICSGKVKDKTEFYMMKREDFPRFLNEHKELF